MSDVFRTIVMVVSHTPIWVWVLYGLLLFLGVQRMRDSSVSLVRVLILPLVVTGLAIWSLVAAGLSALPVMVLSLVAGSIAGWQLEPEGGTRRLTDGRLWLRGEWWSLTQIVVVLVFRYATNVIPIRAPAFNANPVWHWGSLFISAALSGLFLGRTAARLKVYFATPAAP
jgi:hypothetical protein